MKYVIFNIDFDTRKEAEDFCYDYAKMHVDNELDECYEPMQIGYMHFYPSDVLKNLDPIAYRCYIDDMADSYISDIEEYPTCDEDIVI